MGTEDLIREDYERIALMDKIYLEEWQWEEEKKLMEEIMREGEIIVENPKTENMREKIEEILRRELSFHPTDGIVGIGRATEYILTKVVMPAIHEYESKRQSGEIKTLQDEHNNP